MPALSWNTSEAQPRFVNRGRPEAAATTDASALPKTETSESECNRRGIGSRGYHLQRSGNNRFGLRR